MNYCLLDEAALRDAAQVAVERARATGAEAAATVSAGGGARIVARGGRVETAVRDSHQSIHVTVFRNRRTGAASSASLDPASIARAVDEALTIADRVALDPGAGLADPDWLAAEDAPLPELFAAASRDPAMLVEEALAIDAAASGDGRRAEQSGAMANEGLSALATSAGFCRSSRFSMHARWCAVLAADGDGGSVSDHYQSQDRRVDGLEPIERVATAAVERAMSARGARGRASGQVNVLFEPRAAVTLVGDLVGALGGMGQYRGTTFLPDPIGSAVAAAHCDLMEDPFEPFGLASGGFDAEGVAGTARAVLEAGVARGLFLDTRSARRLRQRSTGHAGGPYNLRLSSRDDGGDRTAMLARLGTGLLVTQVNGGATDPVRGTWTRAVAGHWVEHGEIVHAVRDVTLAGAMPDMLRNIVAIGQDEERLGGIRTGSVLIDGMQLGGGS